MQEVFFFESRRYRAASGGAFLDRWMGAGRRARDDPQTLAVRHRVAVALPQFEAVAQMPRGVRDLVLQLLPEFGCRG